jgi:hypothetical protein
LTWPDLNSPVCRFQASTALARAPPAEVPTLRISSSASASFSPPSLPARAARSLRTLLARSTSWATSSFFDRVALRIGRLELEGTDPAVADVAKPVDRAEPICASTRFRKPRIDEPVAELVRQRVGEHARQALEGFPCERGKLVGRFPHRHLQGATSIPAPTKAGSY